jgi:succinate dehydrogenase/fumarate reductase flavoprotein subunit
VAAAARADPRLLPGGLAQNRALVERYYPDALEAGPDLFAISGAGSRGDHVAFAGQAGADMVGEGWGMLLLTAYFARPTLGEVAAAIGVPASTLEATIDRWNAQLPLTGVDPDFERHLTLTAKGADPRLPRIAAPPFYAVRIVPGELVVTHYGMRIDQGAAVLDRAGARISGLFAAGKAGGGVLGPRYVGGGNAISNAITMGRIAGQRAAEGGRRGEGSRDGVRRDSGQDPVR